LQKKKEGDALLLVRNKKNNCNCCPIYGVSSLRKSKYSSLSILFLISSLVFIYSLQNIQTITIPTQIPKAQKIYLRFVEVQNIQSKKPETKKMLAENSDYKIVEPLKSEKIVPEKVKPKKIKALDTNPPQKITKTTRMRNPHKDSPPAVSASTLENQVHIAAEKERLAKQHALSVLIHTLEKNKRYPKAAQRSRTEGTVPLLITINAQGVIIACSIEENKAPHVLVRATKILGEKIIGLNINTSSPKNFQVIVPVAYRMSEW